MKVYLSIISCILLLSCMTYNEENEDSIKINSVDLSNQDTDDTLKKIIKSDKEWLNLLTKEQFEVTRKGGTERAFTGSYWDNTKRGVYHCVCCDLPLFSSETKFKSGTGWPSFYAPLNELHVGEVEEGTGNWKRTEVICNRCNAHLGHVFEDGPKPTGLRYCLNSAALKFYKE